MNSTIWKLQAFRANSQLFFLLAIATKTGETRGFWALKPNHWSEAAANKELPELQNFYACPTKLVPYMIRVEVLASLNGANVQCDCRDCFVGRHLDILYPAKK